MKSIDVFSAFLLMVLISCSTSAQRDKSQRKSPPAQVTSEINEVRITIDYSRPSKRGRDIFGSLEAYGEVWRTGANETSWIEVSKDVSVEGKQLKSGKYGLFTIPGVDEWVIIFNKTWAGWGAYEYKKADDILRITVPTQELDQIVETFTIAISEEGVVSMAWDKTKVEFSIN